MTYKNIQICSILFFVLFAVTFFLLANASVGVVEWLRDPRYAYINYRRGNGALYALSVNFLCLSAFFAFIISKNYPSLVLKFFLYSLVLINFGSKGGIVSLFIFFLTIEMILFGVNLKRYLIALPIGLALVVYMILQSGLNDYLKFLEYFDYFKNAALYYDDYLTGDVKLFGGNIFVSNLWGMVPRSIFEQKPIIYGMLHIVEIYYPGGPASGNTPAFGARVYEFSDFGFAGVILFAALNPWNLFYGFMLVSLFKNKLQIFRLTNFKMCFAFAVLFGPQFGVFFGGISYVALIFVVLVITRFYSKFTY